MLPLKNYRVFKNSLVLSDLTFIVSDFFFFSKYNKNYLALASYLNLTLADFLSLLLEELACSTGWERWWVLSPLRTLPEDVY